MKGVTRLELHEVLCSLLGSRNVYFQPPASLRMKYPCIVYEPQAMTTEHADNQPYTFFDRYRVIYIDQDPDSILPKKIARLKGARAAQPYTADNLHHWPFEIWNVSTIDSLLETVGKN